MRIVKHEYDEYFELWVFRTLYEYEYEYEYDIKISMNAHKYLKL